MERIDLDKIVRAWSLTVFIRGKSKYKKSIPDLIISTRDKKKIIGEYQTKENLIIIWTKPHSSIKQLIKTLLHEYTHYLQHPSWYYRYKNKYGYKFNPYELEANEAEKMQPYIYKEISDKRWNYILKKNKKLKRIYETSIKLISIH